MSLSVSGSPCAAGPPMAVRGAGLGRVAAVLGVGSALVHVLLLASSSPGSLVMAVMALVCLPCAWHLWRRPTASVWGLTAALDATMAAVHLQMTSDAAAMPGMHSGGSPGALMWLGLGLVAGQLALAGTAALRR